VDGVWG